MNPSKGLILGGGLSIRQGLWNLPVTDLPIWRKIQNEFVIGTNFSNLFFPSTVLMYSDYHFYHTQKQWLDKVPLIVGRDDDYYRRDQCIGLGDNVTLLKGSTKYNGINSLKEGLYTFQLVGMAAISFAIGLGCKEIYLLGFDACEINGHTHFYDDIAIGTYFYNKQKYCGIGKHKTTEGQYIYNTGNYNKIKELNEHWFKPFEKALVDGIKIYNVSLESKINTFQKISMEQMFHNIEQSPSQYSQDEIRKEIKCQLSQ